MTTRGTGPGGSCGEECPRGQPGKQPGWPVALAPLRGESDSPLWRLIGREGTQHEPAGYHKGRYQKLGFPESMYQTGPRHGFHQCGIKPTGSDTVSPYISTHDLYMLGTSLCLYAALLLVELMLTTASRLNSAPAERMLWPCLCWSPTEACWARCAHRPDVRRRCVCCHHHA